ncbi:hypothetical protein DFO70_1425 [Cytobacillus firmus]|uniref:Uncharacterized protein n=2 Tax=Cytobacillus TaxID=2675230 RepID=A0A366JG43_CYTFI|nr:hypothetical protein DFO70_1425 [Cytobacillus firmus]TDX35471.1 hypothetical protein DFO72_1275 [Cytobacillus oceanisediminis]
MTSLGLLADIVSSLFAAQMNCVNIFLHNRRISLQII